MLSVMTSLQHAGVQAWEKGTVTPGGRDQSVTGWKAGGGGGERNPHALEIAASETDTKSISEIPQGNRRLKDQRSQ